MKFFTSMAPIKAAVVVRWRPVDEEDYSSAFPGNGARKYA
jgi:hypothetical protein